MARHIKLTGWRRISTATWGAPNDPQVYGDLEVDAAAMLAYISEVRQMTGTRVTVTHLIGRALAHGFAQHAELNVRLHRAHFVERDSIDIFFNVATGGGEDLSGVKVRGADRKSAVEVAGELADRARRIRAGEDADLGATKKLLDRIPPRLLHYLLRLVAWLTIDLNLNLRRFGLPPQAFGSAMITSVAMFGIQHAYAPLSAMYRLPLLIVVGEVTERPVAIQGTVQVRPMLTLKATLDHRYMDGFHAGKLAQAVQEYCADPARFEPPVEPRQIPSAAGA